MVRCCCATTTNRTTSSQRAPSKRGGFTPSFDITFLFLTCGNMMAATGSMTGLFFLIQAGLVTTVYFISRLYWKKSKSSNLDKALIGVVYIALSMGVYPALLSFSQLNTSSHIYIHERVISLEECQNIINAANMEAEWRRGWTTRRHKSYPTTDLSVYAMNTSLSPFVAWLNNTIESRVYPLLERNFAVPSSSLVMRDLFIVKYDEHGQRSLPEHRDNSKISFNIALSTRGLDFQGGGTSFTLLNQTINIDAGSLLSHDSGLYHAGSSVTAGTRLILVGFVQLQQEYWWRAFGTYASCLSYPLGVESEDTGVGAGETLSHAASGGAETGTRSTVCRSMFWIARHQFQRYLHTIYLLCTGVAEDDSTFSVDYGMRIALLALCVLLIFLFLLLGFLCLGGNIFTVSSVDVTLMKWFSLLSEEELAFVEQEHLLYPWDREESHSLGMMPRDTYTAADIETDSCAVQAVHRDATAVARKKKNTGRYDRNVRNVSREYTPQLNDLCKKD